MKLWAWDYDIPDNWKPQTDEEWEWYLVRKLNYNDLTGLTRRDLKRHIDRLDRELDVGKRMLFTYFLTGKAP